MSKKHQKHSQEIPQTGNALEVPNYVIPTEDTFDKDHCGEHCGENCAENRGK